MRGQRVIDAYFSRDHFDNREHQDMPSTYAKKLAATAVGQYNRYHEYSESDPELSAQIKRYWQDLGFDFPGVKTAWSAVFVSWCVKKAGATGKEFAFAAAHAKFVKAAIQNALKGVGVFRGLQIDQYAPKVGDIVQNNRSGNKFTYDFARTHSAYESHSAIVVEVGVDHDGHYLMTIGGNESDSVRRKRIRQNNKGLIIQRKLNPYICVIQDLK
jgi:hypothetical protein